MDKTKMLDSNVFIHAFLKPKKTPTPRDQEIKKRAVEIIRNVQGQKLIVTITTAQIFEITNIIQSWLGFEASADLINFILTEPHIKIYTVSKNDLKTSYEVLKQYKENKIGFNDCVTYTAMKNNEINEILSFDKHFDTFPEIKRLEK